MPRKQCSKTAKITQKSSFTTQDTYATHPKQREAVGKAKDS